MLSFRQIILFGKCKNGKRTICKIIMERRGNRSALCMKRGTQALPSPNWGPPHFTSLAINDEHQHVSRETKRIRLCTHVGRCNRTAYTIHPSSERLVVVRSPYRTVYSCRVLFFRTSSDYRINFERVFLVVFSFPLSLSLFLCLSLFKISYKDDDHPIDHAPIDRGTFFFIIVRNR